jgi:hypothetical protein
MLGFKRFRNAAVTISGIELMHRIRKGQFDLTSVPLKDATAPSIWTAVPRFGRRFFQLVESLQETVGFSPAIEFAPQPFHVRL